MKTFNDVVSPDSPDWSPYGLYGVLEWNESHKIDNDFFVVQQHENGKFYIVPNKENRDIFTITFDNDGFEEKEQAYKAIEKMLDPEFSGYGVMVKNYIIDNVESNGKNKTMKKGAYVLQILPEQIHILEGHTDKRYNRHNIVH